MIFREQDLDLKNDIVIDGKKYLLSTVDLGVWCYGGRYESMVFAYDENGEVNYIDLYCDRYSTKAEAEIGHNALLTRLEAGEKFFWEEEE